MAIEATRRQLLICSLALCFTSCHAAPDLTTFTEEEPPRLPSSVDASDVGAASQLVSGWGPIEDRAWRWTAPHFAAVLRPPPGSPTLGAVLQLHFALPPVEMSRLHQVTLSASVQGFRLAPQTYSGDGDNLYTRDLPAKLLSGDSVRIDFELDKPFIPINGDPRPLGVIGKRVSLETK